MNITRCNLPNTTGVGLEMLGLLQGVEKTAEIYFLHIFFAGLLLGGSNVEK